MMNDSSIFYAIAIIAVLIAGVGKGGFGGGIGVLSVPMMSLFIAPTKAAAIMLPLLCVMDIFGCWHYWKKWDKVNLIILLPAALVRSLARMERRRIRDAH